MLRAFVPAVIVAAAVAAPSASAAPPASPALTPPPPPFETCKAVGAGTICSGTTTFAYGPEDTGIICGDGASVLDSGTVDQHAVRYYDENGRLTRLAIHDVYRSAALTSSTTGATVSYTQHTTSTFELTVPGDFNGATETITGQTNVDVPHNGVVLQSTGRIVFANDAIDFSAGPHDVDAYFSGDTTALAALCAVLAGG
jgi:hypothetical protein